MSTTTVLVALSLVIADQSVLAMRLTSGKAVQNSVQGVPTKQDKAVDSRLAGFQKLAQAAVKTTAFSRTLPTSPKSELPSILAAKKTAAGGTLRNAPSTEPPSVDAETAKINREKLQASSSMKVPSHLVVPRTTTLGTLSTGPAISIPSDVLSARPGTLPSAPRASPAEIMTVGVTYFGDPSGDLPLSPEELRKVYAKTKVAPSTSDVMQSDQSSFDEIGLNKLSEATLNVALGTTLPAAPPRSPPSDTVKADFARFDRNRDKTLTADELSAYLTAQGQHAPDAKEMQAVMETMDSNRDGRITVLELTAFLQHAADVAAKHAARQRLVAMAFEQCDRNDDRAVTLAELKAEMHDAVPDKLIGAMFRAADVNGNGVLNIQEFASFIKAVLEEKTVDHS